MVGMSVRPSPKKGIRSKGTGRSLFASSAPTTSSAWLRSLAMTRGSGSSPAIVRSIKDDGWLVGLVHNRQSGRAEFHVINADDFTGPPQAVVHIPVRIPAGFHGNWIADADLHP